MLIAKTEISVDFENVGRFWCESLGQEVLNVTCRFILVR